MPPDDAIAAAEIIDRVADALEAAWKTGNPPALAAYAAQLPAEAYREGLIELVHLDMEYRRRRGESLTLHDYVNDFPQLAPIGRRLRADFDEASATTDVTAGQTARDSTAPAAAPVAAAAASDALPAAIGKYRVVALVAREGQGEVYRGVHPTLGCDVAIKVSRRRPGDSPAAGERLAAEGRLLAELDHPNIARVFDLDHWQGRPYLVMEFIRGRHLQQYAQSQAPAPRAAAQIVRHIALALAAAHARGVLHLDLKPKNILIDDKNQVRVIDFGLGRMRGAWLEDAADEGAISGTLQYMAPEQARGRQDQCDERTDVFSLGAVLYFLLASRPPYERATAAELLEQARLGAVDFSPPAFLRAPARLRDICRKAMSPTREQRYASAQQVADELLRYLQSGATRRKWLIGLGLPVAGLALWPLLSKVLWKDQSESPITLDQPLEVEVLREDQGEPMWRPLINGLPLVQGDRLRASAAINAGHHAALISFDSEGHFRLLVTLSAESSERLLRFPADARGAELVGEPGTQVLLLCIRRRGPIDLQEIQSLWPDRQPWPAMREDSLLHLERDGVRFAVKGRAFREAGDPDDQVMQRLELLRTALTGRMAAVEGVGVGYRRGEMFSGLASVIYS